MPERPDTREWSTPARYLAVAEANATDDVFDWARRAPDQTAFARKLHGVWHHVTAREFAGDVSRLAAGLVASGVQPGDRIAVMSATRYEWVLCQFAIWTAGAVVVPIYETSSAEQIAWIVTNSEAAGVFVEDQRCLALVEQADCHVDRHVWSMTGGDLDALATAGKDVTAAQVDTRRREVTADALAMIVYTSGTTGRPKGCMLTHANLLGEIRNVVLADEVSEQLLTEQDSILLFLPLAHILAQVVQLAALRNRVVTAHVGSLDQVPRELASFRPTLLLVVPRVFEKVYNTARRKAAAEGHTRIFDAAEDVAVAYSRALDVGGPGLWLKVRHWVFDRLVYAKLRAALGGRVRYAVSGGAPMDPRLGHFLRGAGVVVLEGYGLTETTAAVTINLPATHRIGTVGRPIPGCAVRIAADGEVLLKGPNVFPGYWRNELATDEAFDEDGWFHSGDLGTLDDGYLLITGRKKDLIVTAAGKNVAPAVLEGRLNQHWLIEQSVLVGDQRPYVGVFVTLDLETFSDWKREHGKPDTASVADLTEDPDLVAAIQTAVDEANQAVSAAEAIKRFRIITTQFRVSEELTPTQKVRRGYVLAKLADEVDALYAPTR